MWAVDRDGVPSQADLQSFGIVAAELDLQSGEMRVTVSSHEALLDHTTPSLTPRQGHGNAPELTTKVSIQGHGHPVPLGTTPIIENGVLCST